RCKITENPKNVTQFCQYLTSKTIYLILNNRGIKIDVKDLIKSMKNYKKKQTEKNFKKIFSFFS
ncbi:MAG: hypothetical protein Q8O84_02570, partial [Nanoarchaeota archaeon]|nr:hypothetical protein [Nanoarchaeota archaeon]